MNKEQYEALIRLIESFKKQTKPNNKDLENLEKFIKDNRANYVFLSK